MVVNYESQDNKESTLIVPALASVTYIDIK